VMALTTLKPTLMMAVLAVRVSFNAIKSM